jgi:hypothetical protein
VARGIVLDQGGWYVLYTAASGRVIQENFAKRTGRNDRFGALGGLASYTLDPEGPENAAHPLVNLLSDVPTDIEFPLFRVKDNQALLDATDVLVFDPHPTGGIVDRIREMGLSIVSLTCETEEGEEGIEGYLVIGEIDLTGWIELPG